MNKILAVFFVMVSLVSGILFAEEFPEIPLPDESREETIARIHQEVEILARGSGGPLTPPQADALRATTEELISHAAAVPHTGNKAFALAIYDISGSYRLPAGFSTAALLRSVTYAARYAEVVSNVYVHTKPAHGYYGYLLVFYEADTDLVPYDILGEYVPKPYRYMGTYIAPSKGLLRRIVITPAVKEKGYQNTLSERTPVKSAVDK